LTAPIPDAPLEIGNYAEWAAAYATFLAVLVALFKDEVLRWWRRPRLRVSISLAPPDCHKTTLAYPTPPAGVIKTADCYYLRLWVENIGSARAEWAQVYAAKLLRRNADGLFREVPAFLPMNLRWAHGQRAAGGPEVYAQSIAPGMGKHCDLGRVVDPAARKAVGDDLPNIAVSETILSLDLEVQPNTLAHLVPPGTYRLELKAAAANCRPKATTVEITITGKWIADEARMFSEGLGVRVV
jgi:hypothetical protein